MNATSEATQLGTVMAAAVLDRFGGIEELSLRQIPLPAVGDDDVLIRVQSAGVGSWDAVERQGEYDRAFGVASTFPFVLGWDGAGTVAAVGRNVTRFEFGDRVYAATMPVLRGGFYAEYAAVEEEHVAHVPEKLPTDQAGALAWDALTALGGIEALSLASGDTLMIFGASGGIGHLALQLARRLDVRVLAVASGEDGVALAHRLGADVVVDGRRGDVAAAARALAPAGLDAALVTAGGAAADHALAAVKHTGRVAVPNGVAPVRVSSDREQHIHYDGDRSRTATDRLHTFIEAGPFEVSLARTFPLHSVRAAHRALNAHYVGKIALDLPTARVHGRHRPTAVGELDQ